ncbi:NmrA family NAD(P)-binding protein [Micromonospora marina]|uniref:NmrA family NAD(P)-binding protein n=1 Tax=Micromonospora marina TaxID=307120 RepID=UPI0034535BBB
MIVVTGPSGNVGTELVRMLAERDDPSTYRVLSRNPDRVRADLGADVPAERVDFDDRGTWRHALRDVGTLFLLYPLPHPRTVKTRMTPFVDAAVAAGCRHIVYVSVPGADRFRLVPHYSVERHIERSGATFTFLRSSYFMQNLVRAISTHGVDIADNEELFIPAGKGLTSFLDSRDVAEVAYDALHRPEHHRDRAYVLTGAERLSMDDAATILSDVLGRRIRYPRPSMRAFHKRLRQRGVPRDVRFFMTIVYTLTRTGRNEPLTDDLAQLLGRRPTSFAEFARSYRDRWTNRAWT